MDSSNNLLVQLYHSSNNLKQPEKYTELLSRFSNNLYEQHKIESNAHSPIAIKQENDTDTDMDMENIENWSKEPIISDKYISHKPLISIKLQRLKIPENEAAIFIQKWFRMKLAVEKFKLLRLSHYRMKAAKVIGRGGIIYKKIPFFVVISKGKKNFFIRVKNLLTDKLYYTEIKPIDYVFGYVKTHSYKLLIKSIIEYNNAPAYRYVVKSNKSIDIQKDSFLLFKRYSEKISLHLIVSKLQSYIRAKRERKEFQQLNLKEMQHYKKVINKIEYHIAINFKKTFVFIEVYLLIRIKAMPWLYSTRFENNDLIEKYGEINPLVLLRDLTIENNKLILGQKKSIESYHLERNISYAMNEILIKEQHILNTEKNGFGIKAFLRRYKNDYIDGPYNTVLIQANELIKNVMHSREISIEIEKASEKIGIPSLWIYPITNYIINKCLILDNNRIGLNFSIKKININNEAKKIQNAFKRYLKMKFIKRREGAKRKLSAKYRKTFVCKK